jgi:hypothetical protein
MGRVRNEIPGLNKFLCQVKDASMVKSTTINGSAHSIQALLGAPAAAENTTSTTNTTNKTLLSVPAYVQAAVAGESGEMLCYFKRNSATFREMIFSKFRRT